MGTFKMFAIFTILNKSSHPQTLVTLSKWQQPILLTAPGEIEMNSSQVPKA